MDLYTVNQELLEVLSKIKKLQYHLDEFEQIAESHNKINYLEELLVLYLQTPQIESKFEHRVSKNNEKSLEYRQDGNTYYASNYNHNIKALELYNKSICFAEADSEHLSIGYANRSVALFKWKRYKESLANIRLAREANYPERLIHKLNEREKKCQQMIADRKQPDDPKPHNFVLISDKHPKIPAIADCLDVRYTEDQERHVYTKKDLHPGDLVAVEEPFCFVLMPEMRYFRCANCTKENYLTLIPCPNCTSAMFCSTKCLEEGTELFHKFECPIIDILFTLFNKVQLNAFRLTVVAFSIFESVDELREFCEAECNQNQSAFDIDYKKSDKREHYRAIHGLVTNQEKRSTVDLFHRGITTAVIKHFVLPRTPLNDILLDDGKINLFSDILFRHLQTAPTNIRDIHLIGQKNEKKETYACGAYAFASLLNHSCVPNIVRIYNETKLYLFVTRPIPANGLLYDNYGYHYAAHPKTVRTKNLKAQYHFTCSCEACEQDFPLFRNLLTHPDVPEIVTERDIHFLADFDRDFAYENYQNYRAFLDTFDSFYPCTQLSSTKESLITALNILVESVPLKVRVMKL